jgi:hypothetical protein
MVSYAKQKHKNLFNSVTVAVVIMIIHEKHILIKRILLFIYACIYLFVVHFNYAVSSTDCIAVTDGWLMNGAFERMWKEAAVA